MKNNTQPKLHITLSKEHNKYQSDVADAFKGLDVSFDGGLMRFSAEEMAMQIVLNLGMGVLSSAIWDSIKAGVKKLHKKFKTARITLRDSDSILYTVKPDLSVVVLAVPDRIKEFEHIRNVDDLVDHLQNPESESSKWQSKTLGDFLNKLEGGGTPSKENPNYWNGSIPWASVKDVVTHNPNDTQDHISELGLKHSSSRLVSKGTLIVPTRMALGHAVVFDVDVAINQDLKALYPKKSLLNQYLFHWFKSKKEFIERLGSGSTVSGIQQNELKRIKFNLPPLAEQGRIVSVLDTWDMSIEKLEKKIETKKQIKKALMQDLLTGKKRLSGFNEKWKSVKLGDIATFKKGKGLPKSEIYPDGKYEAIHYGELFTKYSEYIETVISKTNSNKNMFLSKRNDILMPTSDVTPRGLSTASYLDKDGVVLGGDILVIRSSGSLNGLFFCYIVNLNKKEVIKLVSGSTVFHLYGSDMAKFELKLPPLKEQESIVKILVTADKEITELEKKLSIIKEQKRYLLNNLITGTIRTPETLSTKLTK